MTEHSQSMVQESRARSGLHSRCVHDLVSEQARRTPDAVALRCDDRQISYAELERRANRLAHHLQSLGVGPDVIVGLCHERSIGMVVGLLGILKAGGAYLPLDPQYPSERLALMLEDAKTSVIVTSSLSFERLPSHEAVRVGVDGDWPATGEQPPMSGVTAANLAYVLYTSGSTGKPKGVLGTHGLVAQRLLWDGGGIAETYAQKTTPNFIDALWEVFMPLVRGQSVSIVPADIVTDPRRMIDSLAAGGATRIVLVPALLRALLSCGEDLAEQLPLLRYWACSGEALDTDLANEFKRRLPGARLLNIYGTSEFWDASVYEVTDAGHTGGIPIGRPLSNTRVYVLDEELEPVPVGVVGELYVGGTGLARGYLNRPGLTAERFIADPFGDGDRLYASGDLARYRSDGNLEFLGRRDSQVKIRGFRIELAEIESALRSHVDVSHAVVVAREDEPGQKRLIGYVVSSEDLDIARLREHVQSRLPQHMVPSAFVVLRRLPLTPSGKVDRLALPVPDARPQIGRYVAPRTVIEHELAAIWCEALRLDRVGVDDNFFELGGDSLSATRVAVRTGLPTHAVFEEKTISRLAARLNGDPWVESVALEPLQWDREVQATHPQRLLLSQGPYEVGLNMGNAMSVAGPLDEGALRRSLQALLQRQSALRSTFVIDGSDIRMRIGSATPDILRVIALERCEDDPERRIDAEIAGELLRPFDLQTGPLARALLIRLSALAHVLVLTFHHAVADAWSINIIKRELALFYAAELDESKPRPGPLTISYSDFAHWQHQLNETSDYQRQLAYWLAELVDVKLDGVFPRNAQPQAAAAASSHLKIDVPGGVQRQLKEFAAHRGLTVYVVFMAALHLALAKYSGLRQQAVWTPVVRRARSELEHPVGLFVNLLMVAARADSHLTLGEFLALIDRKVMQAHANADVSAMTPLQMGLVRPQPLPVVGLNFIDLPNACDWQLAGATVVTLDLQVVDEACALELSMQFEQGHMTGAVMYKPAVFTQEGVAQIIAYVWDAMDNMMNSSHRRITDWRSGGGRLKETSNEK